MRDELLDVKNDLFKNKLNPEIYDKVLEKQQRIRKKIARNLLTINYYELENNIERGIENDQHKGK